MPAVPQTGFALRDARLEDDERVASAAAASTRSRIPAREVGCGARRRRRSAHAVLWHTAACLAFASLPACAGLNTKPTQPDLQPWPEIRPDFRVESLRGRMHEYAITFAAEVDLAASSLERRAADATVRRNALLWRVRGIPEMRKACFRLEPVAALVDAWVFARQMEQLFSEGAGAGAFGTFQDEVVAVSHRLVQQVREIGGSIAVSPETRVEFERRFIDPFLADHPLRDLTFIRDSSIARFAEQYPARGDILQSVGTMEDLAVGLSQQARIYLAELPRQVRGEVDLMRTDLLSAEDVATMQGDLHQSAAAVDRLAASAESVSPLVLSERRIVLDEISRQRALVMGAISVERERAVHDILTAFAAERRGLLRDIESQRLATLEWATTERHETTADVYRQVSAALLALRAERVVIVNDLRHAADVILLRVALFLVAGVVLAPLVAHAYARVWPQRWASHGPAHPAREI
jgi:hypothetical protein